MGRMKAPDIVVPEMSGARKSVSFDTAKMVLVPAGLYEKGGAEEYLRFNGMTLSSVEVAVVSEPLEGIVAVMGIPADVWEQYRHEYEKGGVGVTSPLLSVATGHGRTRRAVDLLLTEGNLYLAVWEKGLQMAEALPDNSTDSILYYMQVVGRSFKLRKFDINVYGERAGIVADTLRHYYKKVRVADS